MFLSELLNLRVGFQRYFEVVPALTEELRRESYRIRHEVYCRELGFEPVRADGLETDRYDAHSVHCLLRTAATRQYVGCVRVIRPPRDDPALPLPFEVTCEEAWESGALGQSEEHAALLPYDEALEASIDEALGLQPISIRLEKSLIEDFKLIAQLNGLGYQPLMRQALKRFADCEIKRIMRDLVAQKAKDREAAATASTPRKSAKPKEKKAA